MKEKEINIRFNHAGQFQKTGYVGGQTMIITRVEVDTFSYGDLMEDVKNYLHYTEIGGVYIVNEKGGWQLLTNDADLMGLVEGCDHGEEIDFYVDNTVDKEIEPLPQMQPHVTIRPRKNLIQASAKKPLKRKFVTTHQLQQQKKMSLRSAAPVLLTSQQDVMKEKGSGTVRRKLNLQNDTIVGEKTGENEVALQKSSLTQYEKDRLERMKENREVLKSFGIVEKASSLFNGVVQNSKGEDKKTKNPEEDEYDPEKEDEVDSEDTSERIRASKAKKLVGGPRTRSRAKVQARAESEGESRHASPATRKGTRQTRIENEKEVTSSYRAPVLKPTCSKVFKQTINGETPGSANAYLAMRERQKLNIAPPIPEDVPELNLEETEIEVVKAPRKPRGRTKMAKVYARSSDEKVVITLNADGQPISIESKKVVNELTNFVGTLARDNVSLTYINWHVVPEKLKNQLWEHTLTKYVIPDEGKEWVYNTLNAAWRLHKSRFKSKHYTRYETDEERIEKRPDDVSLEDFKVLLAYWGDEEVKALAKENAERRKELTETHTMGPKTLAQVRVEMKKSDPKLASPSDGKLFLKTRERKPGRKYKSNTETVEKRMAEIKKLIHDGKDAEADLMVRRDKDHAPNFLVGRRGKKSVGKSSGSTSLSTDHYVQELTAKIKRDLESELEAKVNKKVQENMAWMLKKMGDANPDLKLDVGDFCAMGSSHQDENGTPGTQGGATS